MRGEGDVLLPYPHGRKVINFKILSKKNEGFLKRPLHTAAGVTDLKKINVGWQKGRTHGKMAVIKMLRF